MRFFAALAVLLALLAISYFLALEFHKAATARGWPQRRYFWICFLLPPAGYLLVLALPDRGGPALGAYDSDELPEL